MFLRYAAPALVIAFAPPALAQDEAPREPFRTRVTLGPQLVPSHPGSDEVSLRPFIDVARARILECAREGTSDTRPAGVILPAEQHQERWRIGPHVRDGRGLPAIFDRVREERLGSARLAMDVREAGGIVPSALALRRRGAPRSSGEESEDTSGDQPRSRSDEAR